jgi:hypothetical protein
MNEVRNAMSAALVFIPLRPFFSLCAFALAVAVPAPVEQR